MNLFACFGGCELFVLCIKSVDCPPCCDSLVSHNCFTTTSFVCILRHSHLISISFVLSLSCHYFLFFVTTRPHGPNTPLSLFRGFSLCPDTSQLLTSSLLILNSLFPFLFFLFDISTRSSLNRQDFRPPTDNVHSASLSPVISITNSPPGPQRQRCTPAATILCKAHRADRWCLTRCRTLHRHPHRVHVQARSIPTAAGLAVRHHHQRPDNGSLHRLVAWKRFDSRKSTHAANKSPTAILQTNITGREMCGDGAQHRGCNGRIARVTSDG